jgi:hypothetical protein
MHSKSESVMKQAAIAQNLKPSDVDTVDREVEKFLNQPQVRDSLEKLEESDKKLDDCIDQLAEIEAAEDEQSNLEFIPDDLLASSDLVVSHRVNQHEMQAGQPGVHFRDEHIGPELESQKDSTVHEVFKHATTLRQQSEEFAKNHPFWTKAGNWALKSAGYLSLAGLIKAGLKLGGKKMLAFCGAQLLSQELIASVIENGTEALVDYALSLANTPQEAEEFAKTALWAVEMALDGAAIAGVAVLIKDKVAITNKLQATKVDIPATARAKFAQRQALRTESSRNITAIAEEKAKNIGRQGQQARLRELMDDHNLGSADRGWLRQEKNIVDRGKRRTMHVPPGKHLAHPRGFEAAKGYDHRNSYLQEIDLHKAQHKFDNMGKLNRDRGKK